MKANKYPNCYVMSWLAWTASSSLFLKNKEMKIHFTGIHLQIYILRCGQWDWMFAIAMANRHYPGVARSTWSENSNTQIRKKLPRENVQRVVFAFPKVNPAQLTHSPVAAHHLPQSNRSGPKQPNFQLTLQNYFTGLFTLRRLPFAVEQANI